MSKQDIIFMHAPSVYDFRKKPIFYGPVSDVIPSSPVFEMYPIGFMTMSSHLERAGFRTRIVNLAVQMLQDDKFDVEKKIKSLNADVFAIDLHWMPHCHGAIEVAKLIKKYHPDVKVEFGGFSSSYFAEDLIRRPEIDLVMRGDTTEEPTVRMMKALQGEGSMEDVPNLLWKDEEGKVHDNVVNYCLEDLDSIEFDYGLMIRNVLKYHDIKGAIPWLGWDKLPLTSVFTVRGCSFNCAECGGSHFANKRVVCRNKPAYRSPEKLAEDMESIQNYLDTPIFIVGDLRQNGMDYVERFLKEVKERKIENHAVVELFRGADEEYFRKLDSVFEGGWTIQFSPDSHDEEVRFALGKGYTNEAIERTVVNAFGNGCKRMDLFYMTGLPRQSRESALDNARAAKKLWDSVDKDDGLFIYTAPFAPFVDPGSRAFEEPEKWGYRFFARTLDEHRKLLDNPSWKLILSYETDLMSRDMIAETSYDAAKILADIEHECGRISDEEHKGRIERTEIARSLMHRIDDIMTIVDVEKRDTELWALKEEGANLMNSTVCNKNDLDWDAGSIWKNSPRVMKGLLKSKFKS